MANGNVNKKSALKSYQHIEKPPGAMLKTKPSAWTRLVFNIALAFQHVDNLPTPNFIVAISDKGHFWTSALRS